MKIYTFDDDNNVLDIEVIQISSQGTITMEHVLGQTPTKDKIGKLSQDCEKEDGDEKH